jgi:hypothetical protein
MMQYATCSPIVPHVTRRQARPPAWVRCLASHRTPPSLRGRAGSLSGRPFCRIYLEKQVWILELDSASGAWIGLANAGDRMGYPSGPSRLTFPTLSAAIGYAEYHGLDYRVIAPPRPRRLQVNAKGRRTRPPHPQIDKECELDVHRPRQETRQ